MAISSSPYDSMPRQPLTYASAPSVTVTLHPDEKSSLGASNKSPANDANASFNLDFLIV